MVNPTSLSEPHCELSPQAHALSILLLAYISAVVTGAIRGKDVTLLINLSSSFAPFRLLIVGIWAVSEAIHGHPLNGGDQYRTFWERALAPFIPPSFFASGREHDTPFLRGYPGHSPPTALGWVGWGYRNLYTPISHMVWLNENWNSASAGLRIVRAMNMWARLLPFTFDTQARYGDDLEKRFGVRSRQLFSLVSAINFLLLTMVSIFLLLHGVFSTDFPLSKQLILVGVCAFFTLVSLVAEIPRDEAKPVRSRGARLAGIAMGLFTGISVAAPALILYFEEPDSPGSDLITYMGCQPLGVWRKFMLVFP